MTRYGKKQVVIAAILLGTALLAGCSPEIAEDEAAAAKELTAAAAPVDRQTNADQES